jgi:hypothetical protein
MPNWVSNPELALKEMKCEELQFNLPLYAEGELDLDESSLIKEHLGTCPVCRVKLSEFQNLQNDFRTLSRPAIPSDLVFAVKNSVRDELVTAQPQTWLSEEWREWLQMRLMPYFVGTAVAFSCAFVLLLSLSSVRQSTNQVIDTARIKSNRTVVVTNIPSVMPDDAPVITNEELAYLRTPVSSESPSLNTRGILLTMTNSLMRGKMKNDEITFVADVFSNGLSQIAEVVEAPHSRKSMEDLSKALENDPAFVPAELDRRSNVVRVVFKIQRVDVFDVKPTKSKRNL